MKTISIVVPVYRNASSLPDLARELDALDGALTKYNFEFIFVDDGSEDESFAVLEELASHDERIRILKLSRNFGSNTAILAGLTYASGDAVGFIAADLQDPPSTFKKMIAEWEQGPKVVLAARQDRDDPITSRIFASLFNRVFKRFVFKDSTPQGIGFFLVDRQVVDVLVQSCEKNAHLIGLVLWSGYEKSIVYYDRVAREHGSSAWTFSKKVKYSIDAFAAFSYLPLRIASFLGLALASSGFLYALAIVILRIRGGINIEGWSALMIVVLLTSGVQLLIMGVLGEYLWRNFDATRKRPLFIVDRTCGFPADNDLGLSSKKDEIDLPLTLK